MNRSREILNHPIRQILNRSASGFAPVDEEELAELHVDAATRDRVRTISGKLYDVARSGGMRARAHARTLAEDHLETIVDGIPPEYRHAVRADPEDTGFTTSDAAAVGERIHTGDSHRTTSESIDQRIARRGRSVLDRLGS